MRTSGVLMHLTSLPSPYGVGTMGQAARDFADFLAAAGQTWWQILPIGPTSFGDSPYQSFSTFAGNPYLIDLDDLAADGLLKREEYASLSWGDDPRQVDFGLLYRQRNGVLRRAVQRLLEAPPADYGDFLAGNGSWLPDYALFMALKEENGGRSWQEWKLVSAHGCACDPVAECMTNKAVFFLTGGTETPATLCRKLAAAGMGAAHGVVGENLGTEAEAIRYGSAAELAGQNFAPLSVLLVENFDLPQFRSQGWPDEAFTRGDVPMTKQEVRAAALAKLAVTPTDTLWDVGAGTGSVSVELALAAPKGRVYAVECEPDACALIRKNREKFRAYNLTLIEGKAPEALDGLPAPDAVFIGGTKGGMEAVLDAVLTKNAAARICISAIALETLSAAITALTARGLTAEVTQIAVSRTKPAGRLHLLMANNPTFLITGTRK